MQRFGLLTSILLAAISVSAQIQQDTALANQIMHSAHEQFDRKQYDSAFDSFHEARLLIEPYEVTLPNLFGRALFYEGQTLQYQRKDEEALALYLRSLEHLDVGTPYLDSVRADLYNNIGGTYINLGFRSKGKPYLEQALDIESQLVGTNTIGAAVTNYNLGLANMYLGESFSALNHFMQALPVYLRNYGENGARVAQLYTNVGLLHRETGDLEIAEEYFRRGVDIHLYNHGPDYWNLAYPYTSLGGVYMDRKDWASALNYYLMAQKICRENRDRLIRVEAIVAAALANVYRELGDYTEAHASVDEAIKIFNESYHADHPRFADYYRIKGNIYLVQDRPDEASRWYEKSIETIRNAYGDKHPNLASAFERLAWMNYQEKSMNNSLKYIQLGYQSLSDDYKSDVLIDFPDQHNIEAKKHLIRLLNLHARVLRDRKFEKDTSDLKNGVAILENAAKSIDALRQGYLTEEAKIFIQENSIDTYEGAVYNLALLHDMTGDRNYLKEAFRYFEKSKSTVLSESIQSSRMYIPLNIDSTLAMKEKSVNRDIRDLEISLSQEQNDSIQRVLKQSLFVKRREADSIGLVIKRDWPEYYKLKYQSDVVSASEVMAGLPAESAMLTYLKGDSSWYVMTLTATDISLFETDKISDESLQGFTELIRDPGSNNADYIALGHELYKTLVALPLAGSSPETLLIIPDGQLYYVPFDALSTSGETENPGYLVSSLAIRYLNSATLQAAGVTNDSYKYSYMGFAPSYVLMGSVENSDVIRDDLVPLGGNLEEVNFAGNIFRGEVFVNDEATKRTFQQDQISTRILHLAMHATADDDNPMHSGLWFSSSDSSQNAYLNAEEIYGLNIQSELVVLSACNTGVGKVRRGEGVMSLSRAFMYAGCPNIVMSLWRASDQPSSIIMKAFFENLNKQLPKSEALRQAKLAYLADADPLESHPAYWASFVLVGDNKPITKPYNLQVIVILLFLLVILIGGILIRNKKISR